MQHDFGFSASFRFSLTMKIVPLALTALHDGLTLNSIASGVMTTIIAMFVIVVLRIISRKVYKIRYASAVSPAGRWAL